MTYLEDNRERLERRHYINDAKDDSHWFDVNQKKYEWYFSRYGEEFCLVLVMSLPYSSDDAYVLPVRDLRGFFSPDCLREDKRWMGNITDGGMILKLNGKTKTERIEDYYNAFKLLDARYVRPQLEYV